MVSGVGVLGEEDEAMGEGRKQVRCTLEKRKKEGRREQIKNIIALCALDRGASARARAPGYWTRGSQRPASPRAQFSNLANRPCLVS